ATAELGREACDGIASRNEQPPPLRYRVDDLEGRSQPFGRGANKRTLHGRQVKGNRGDARCAARGLSCRALSAARWTYEHAAIRLAVLHVCQDRSGHLCFHAGEVGTRTRERLLDLINENDDAWGIDAGEHCS